MYNFNICDNRIKDVQGIQHIHPRKQRQVAGIVKKMKPYADSIRVFGSATRWDCNEKSDLDIAITPEDNVVDIKGLNKLLQQETNFNFDLLEINDIDKQMSKYQKENIIDKGIVFYAK
jgi:predicted nucleotidyltransferase